MEALNIPHFIEAATKQELQKKMLMTNSVVGGHIHYFDIQKDGKKWVAWYYMKADKLVSNMLDKGMKK